MLEEGLEVLSEPGLTSLPAAVAARRIVPHGSTEGVRAVRLPLPGSNGCHARQWDQEALGQRFPVD
eukprot:497627-Lingulodinium_polyedra.AAC.1